MSASPSWKIYSADGRYIAACHHLEDAAALAALNGPGTTIRAGHAKSRTVWHEGAESRPAADSYDYVALVAADRHECRRYWPGAEMAVQS